MEKKKSRWICCFKKNSHVQPALVGTNMLSDPLSPSNIQQPPADSFFPHSLTLLAISHHNIWGCHSNRPPKKQNTVYNTTFWRQHANVLFVISESVKGKPVTVCKCYANASAGKDCKCVWVYSQESTHLRYWWELSNDHTFPQELTDLLTFRHACMHTWTSAPSAKGEKSHQLASVSWFIWEIEQSPQGKILV